MAISVLAEAKNFLFRHPWATTEADNPVDIIKDLIREAGEADRLRKVLLEVENKLDKERERSMKLRALAETMINRRKLTRRELREALGA